ncbi:cysteine desulfurase family protein [Hyphomicrobium sp. D-2]|uniref:cysteine desulfurase family protein n=1 Tax=Hyphomicrobium sp. D-2 TaxID=3041621 RepID=UPI0024544B69|nr:cysteine desulfurase family protein [Hyphomicrobium sp. D-2]MDH4982694.1 cysteine desulfurase family protein [Hyphomicrobium sp. D-2]
MTRVRTYLDYNASAPLRPAAREAVLAALDAPGNASSVHAEGRRARTIIEGAREHVAALVGATPSEVVFTSGATEANNCVMAAGWAAICVADIEHDPVLAPARGSGAEIIKLPVSTDGVVDLAAAREALAEAVSRHQDARRVLLSVMMANNETGVIQPVAKAGNMARDLGIQFHVDAVQGVGRLPFQFSDIGADTLTISAHKLGGPRGVGALIVGDGNNLPALVRGGGQERRRRGGTENVAGIAGFGAAAAEVQRECERSSERLQVLRDRLEADVMRETPAAVIIGRNVARIANTSCIAMPGKPSETLVIRMDLDGIAISSGAACTSGKIGENTVLAAMGLDASITGSAVRVSLGAGTTDDDVTAFLAAWKKAAGGTALAA